MGALGAAEACTLGAGLAILPAAETPCAPKRPMPAWPEVAPPKRLVATCGCETAVAAVEGVPEEVVVTGPNSPPAGFCVV